MTGRPLCVVPANLWLLLVSPTLTQFCVLSRCHKLVLIDQERYPWTPSCRSSFFLVELSKFEFITSLERIVFYSMFLTSTCPSWHSRDWRSDLRHIVNLSCYWFWAFCIRRIQQRICVLHKIWVMSLRLA